MSQKRFWNWLDEDSTFDLSRWHLGLIDSGLYRGFDVTSFVDNETMTITMNHLLTGAVRTKIDRTISPLFGVLVTKQGVVVQEDENKTFEITPSTTPRWDLIVFQHEYKEIDGGIDGEYLVIEGDSDGEEPALTNPALQIILGKIYLPENCSSLNTAGVIYVRPNQPNFAAGVQFIEKENGTFLTSLSGEGNKIINLGNPTEAQDAATKYYVDLAIATNTPPATETNRGVIEIADMAETLAGVDDLRAITPLKLYAYFTSRKASQAEVNDGTDDQKFVTPQTLEGKFATETRKGIARIATEAEVEAGLDDMTIVTPFKLKQFLGFKQYLVPIGAWDMTATEDKVLSHTFPWWDKVVAINVLILGDDGVRFLFTNAQNVNIDATNIYLKRDDTAFFNNANFNVTGAYNRGYVTFWVESTIVPATTFISVNAGADVFQSHRLLRWGTPVLTEVKIETVGSLLYPSAIPKLKASYTQGIGNNIGTFKLFAKRKVPATGSLFNDWKMFGAPGSPLNPDTLEGYIVDTASPMSGDYYIRVVCTVLGMDLISNEIEIDETAAPIGTTWTDTTSVSTVTDRTFDLSGLAESIGSPLDSILWELVTSPVGSTVIIDDDSNLITNFKTDTFGSYVFKLTATNAVPQSADDTVIFNIAEITNIPPVALAKWTVDNSTAPKTATIDSSSGLYHAVSLQGSFSYDNDGVINKYQWQWKKVSGVAPLFDWQDMELTDPDFIPEGSVSITMNIQLMNMVGTVGGAGVYEFRLRVRDNLGEFSSWSNTLEYTLNVTSSPTTSMFLNIISGGAGTFHTQAQLIVSPIGPVTKLVAKTITYTVSGGPALSNDFYLKVQGGGSMLQYFGASVGTERNITSVMTASGGNMTVTLDLNNTPPNKYCQVQFIAYDAANNVLNTKTLTMGHL